MPIPAEHAHRYIYHFTHIENLPGILRNGFHSPNEQRRLGLSHKSIAAAGIQGRRAAMEVTCGPGGFVHDYVPFYFCRRSSMLLSVVNKKNVDQIHLIYFAVPISVIERENVVFSRASANTVVPPRFYCEPKNLAKLDWAAIDDMHFSLSSDQQNQARMAEALMHEKCDIGDIERIITWNDHIGDKVQKIFERFKVACPRIVVNSKFYFTKFPSATQKSLVTGPYVTKLHYLEAIKHVKEKGQNSSARFPSLVDLLVALRGDLSILPETNELIGLQSDNARHHEDVGAHTISVVNELLASEEYSTLNSADKKLVEIAAYLHDIGKGPKVRWKSNGGRQKNDPDHPIGSVIMLRRILTEEIAMIKPRSIRVLAKLICYHDLVGDIVGKGRNEEQLEDIAGSQRELDMLIALGKADMKALGFERDDDIAELRERILAKLEATEPDDNE